MEQDPLEMVQEQVEEMDLVLQGQEKVEVILHRELEEDVVDVVVEDQHQAVNSSLVFCGEPIMPASHKITLRKD